MACKPSADEGGLQRRRNSAPREHAAPCAFNFTGLVFHHLGHGTTLSKMRSLRRLDRLLFWYCPTPLGTSAAGTRATCRGRQYGTDVQQPPLSLLRR
jgi:hypothetical protein